jgi:lysozyme
MKKIIFCIIIPLVALFSTNLLTGTPTPQKPRLKAQNLTKRPVAIVGNPTDSVRLEEELKYYLERHNLQDEGYEMVVAFAGGHRHEVDVDHDISVWNVGRWKGHPRSGTTLALDSLGRTIVGTCIDDSLMTGIRPDSAGTYRGDFLNEKSAGHGSYTTTASYYYEGHWENGLRNGFGLETAENAERETCLRVGEWKNDRFMGERMRYTTERIYGIDIARYQHGKGRKKYPILWDRLRITNVGQRGSRNVSGTADYPVSFVYIKSTEGKSIRNQYYVNDYAKARKQGIRAGAYHFWSVRTTGAEQAQFFINHTLFRSGDLPPVLDIEPSKAQIQQAGGPERLFREIRTWLRMVEHRAGVKPILYVNQMFVNKHLSKQTDLKRNYSVWIARYSEYKPDVKLTYWQLCHDGRVAGIQGDVDINVFNGYQSQFETFLEEVTIK